MDLWQHDQQDDNNTAAQFPRNSVSHHAVDVRVPGEGGLGRWPQSLGGLV